MSSEEQELLAKIGQVSGQINRHKYTQDPTSSASYRQSPYPQYPVHSSRGSMVSPTQFDKRATDRSGDFAGRRGGGIRGTSRGAYSMRGRGHRNRTLVLNGNPPNAENQSTVAGDENESPSAASATAPSYITKIDRHNIQLINSSVYEKNSQIRTKAIEETRQQKLKQRNDREKLKFHKHLQHMSNSSASYPAGNTSGYQIDIHGILFNVAKNGSKLVKVPGDINYGKVTPKTALVGGVHFHRSKNGNMYRSGVVKAYRRSGVVKKVNEPCKIFTTTGSCLKGPKCRYIHDLSKVAVCKDFLQKGSCPSGDSCDLSHDLTPERTPACLHFGKGNCANPNCRYTHVHVSPNALNCRAFGVYGYCEKGANCAERHAFECPEFANTGNCTTKGCKLLHRYKASVMRRNLASGETGSAEDNSDISSDDEDEIDSDDVDSDDLLEEYFGDDDGKTDTDVPMQQDFVHFA